MTTFIFIIHVFTALGIIGLVLLQRGKGADAGAGFGAGASGTVFGARGSATVLSKMTAVLVTVFFLTSLALTYLNGHRPDAPKGLLERAGAAQTAPAPTGMPGASPATVPVPPPTAPQPALAQPSTAPALNAAPAQPGGEPPAGTTAPKH